MGKPKGRIGKIIAEQDSEMGGAGQGKATYQGFHNLLENTHTHTQLSQDLPPLRLLLFPDPCSYLYHPSHMYHSPLYFPPHLSIIYTTFPSPQSSRMFLPVSPPPPSSLNPFITVSPHPLPLPCITSVTRQGRGQGRVGLSEPYEKLKQPEPLP